MERDAPDPPAESRAQRDRQTRGNMARQKKNVVSFQWSDKGRWDVSFTRGMFDENNDTMARVLREATGSDTPRVLVVADSNVVRHAPGLGSGIGRYVMEHDIELASRAIVAGGGEKLKLEGAEAVARIVEEATSANLARTDAILAIGGGALLDVASFAGACICGGVKTVRVPTTPAAMADGAYAETAAYDFREVKDAVRLTARPAAVVVDPQFATSVLDGVWRGGLGSIIRSCAAGGEELVAKFMDSADYLRCHDIDALEAVIKLCVEARQSNGVCRIGEWCARKLEAMSGFRLPHGYAIPMGVCIDCGYAVARGIMEPSDRDAIRSMFADCGALDGLSHSHHLLSQVETLLEGLDAWLRTEGGGAVELLAAPGKRIVEKAPDRALYEATIKDFLSESIGAQQ